MRHGETDWNKELRIQGSTDIPLNENGIKLAEHVSEAVFGADITFDRIFSSPLQRARQTAEIMNKFSKAPIFIDERIREFCFGEAEGVTYEELKTNPKFLNLRNWFLDPENYKAELGAESYVDFFSRIDSFLEDVKKVDSENILIVCHGGVVRGLLKEICGWPIAKFASAKIPNCGLNLAKFENGKFTVEYTARVFQGLCGS